MAVRLLMIRARMVSSSVLWFSSAKTTTGIVAQMPWLPLPELLITGIMAPAMRASQAQLVADSTLEKMPSPIIPRPSGLQSVLPSWWPKFSRRPSAAAASFIFFASSMKRRSSTSVSTAKSYTFLSVSSTSSSWAVSTVSTGLSNLTSPSLRR